MCVRARGLEAASAGVRRGCALGRGVGSDTVRGFVRERIEK